MPTTRSRPSALPNAPVSGSATEPWTRCSSPASASAATSRRAVTAEMPSRAARSTTRTVPASRTTSMMRARRSSDERVMVFSPIPGSIRGEPNWSHSYHSINLRSSGLSVLTRSAYRPTAPPALAPRRSETPAMATRVAQQPTMTSTALRRRQRSGRRPRRSGQISPGALTAGPASSYRPDGKRLPESVRLASPGLPCSSQPPASPSPTPASCATAGRTGSSRLPSTTSGSAPSSGRTG